MCPPGSEVRLGSPCQWLAVETSSAKAGRVMRLHAFSPHRGLLLRGQRLSDVFTSIAIHCPAAASSLSLPSLKGNHG